MIAKYDGKCAECRTTIVGRRDEIERDTLLVESLRSGVIAERFGPWRHVTCPEPRETGTCTECFLQKPCPCGDGQ